MANYNQSSSCQEIYVQYLSHVRFKQFTSAYGLIVNTILIFIEFCQVSWNFKCNFKIYYNNYTNSVYIFISCTVIPEYH